MHSVYQSLPPWLLWKQRYLLFKGSASFLKIVIHFSMTGLEELG